MYLRDSAGAACDIEMKVRFSRRLPKRSRYYAPMIDMDLLGVSVAYKGLKPSVIICICPFDLVAGKPSDDEYVRAIEEAASRSAGRRKNGNGGMNT